MSPNRDDRLLRVAQDLVDGREIDWEDVLRREPDLASELERLRQLEAFASAAGDGVNRDVVDGARPLEPVLFSWGEIQALEKIDTGSFAEVYRAWDPGLEREVALKLSRPDTGRSANVINKWTAQILAEHDARRS